MIQGGYEAQDATDFIGREDDREFELGVGANQFDFGGPGATEGFLPEDFDGADGLGAGLAGYLLVLLEVDEILAKVLRADSVGGLMVVFAELTDAGEVSLLGARTDGQQLKIIGEGF